MEVRQNLEALRTAVPYVRAFKHRVMVVKLGGRLCTPGDHLINIIDQIGLLYQLGIKVILVHGGGDQADELAARLGIETRRVAGRRVTDKAMLDVAKLTFAGSINTDILAVFRRASLPAVGLSGIDGGLVTVHKRPPRLIVDPATGNEETVDFGYVGDIERIDTEILEKLLDSGFVPVICSLAAGDDGQIYNVNADTIASSIAVSIKAAKYFCVSTVDGVLDDVGDRATLHSYLDVAQLEALIQTGRITGGMLPKLAGCMDALRGGVPRVHIINGLVTDSLLAEIFTNEGCGTLLVLDRASQPGGAPV